MLYLFRQAVKHKTKPMATKPKEITISERIAALQADITKLKAGLVGDIETELARVERLYIDFGKDPKVWNLKGIPALLLSLGLSAGTKGKKVVERTVYDSKTEVGKAVLELVAKENDPRSKKWIVEQMIKAHKGAWAASTIGFAVGDMKTEGSLKVVGKDGKADLFRA
jgi:hypothetical protein